MGQVETKQIFLGSQFGARSGEVYTLRERLYLTAERDRATSNVSEGRFLLGNEGDEILLEDAIKYGLVDGDTELPEPVLDLDARTVTVDELQKAATQLASERERLEADKALFAQDKRAVAVAENHPDRASEVVAATETSSGVTIEELDAEWENLQKAREALQADRDDLDKAKEEHEAAVAAAASAAPDTGGVSEGTGDAASGDGAESPTTPSTDGGAAPETSDEKATDQTANKKAPKPGNK